MTNCDNVSVKPASRTTRRLLGLTLAMGWILAAWSGRAATASRSWKQQGPGLAYCCDEQPRVPLAVYVVRIDRSQPDLELYTTLGGVDRIGVAVLSEQVRSIKPSIGQSVAAINGDYFFVQRPFIGDPRNLQILRGGELVSGPGEDRAFFYLDAKGQPHLTNAVAAFTVTWPNGKTSPIGLNEYPEADRAVLYTSAVGLTTGVEGTDLILERCGQKPWLPLRIGETLNARVRRVNPRGFSRIEPDGMVLSLYLENRQPTSPADRRHGTSNLHRHHPRPRRGQTGNWWRSFARA